MNFGTSIKNHIKGEYKLEEIMYYISLCSISVMFRTNMLDHVSENLHTFFASVMEGEVGQYCIFLDEASKTSDRHAQSSRGGHSMWPHLSH